MTQLLTQRQLDDIRHRLLVDFKPKSKHNCTPKIPRKYKKQIKNSFIALSIEKEHHYHIARGETPIYHLMRSKFWKLLWRYRCCEIRQAILHDMTIAVHEDTLQQMLEAEDRNVLARMKAAAQTGG